MFLSIKKDSCKVGNFKYKQIIKLFIQRLEA